RDAVPHRHVFYKHSVPTGRWAYDQASVILRSHPKRCSTQIKNPKSTINNRKSIPVPAGPNVCSKKGEGDNPSRRDGMFMLTWHMRLTRHYLTYPTRRSPDLRDAVPHRHVFYKHSVPTGRWSYDQVSVILRFHPKRCSTQIKNPKSTINNRKSIPVPAGPNVCSKKGEGDNPSRRDGMFMLTWHMRLTGHYIRYPDITLRPYGTRHLHAHGFYKHCVPTGRWAYDQASVILRFHPKRCSTQIKNPKSTIDNRKSIPVPAGPNVCSTIPERGHPSRRDGMFMLTWHMRLTAHYNGYPDITLRPYGTPYPTDTFSTNIASLQDAGPTIKRR